MYNKKSRLALILIFVVMITVIASVGTVGVFITLDMVLGDALHASDDVRLAKANAYASATSSTPQGGVVFYGDSIIELYNLDKHFPSKGYINRGISGDKTSDMLSRLYSNVIALAPRTVIIIVGINDMGHDVPLATAMGNYRTMITRLRSELPQCNIAIQSLYPLRPSKTLMGLIGVKSRTNDKVLEWNKSILSLAAELRCTYLNIHPLLLDTDGKLIANYSREGLHINDNGYAVISKYISGYIDEVQA